MCAVSMVGDFYTDKWGGAGGGATPWAQSGYAPYRGPTQEEFDALKREVTDMKELLKRAKAYDERTGQPDCEIEEKMDVLRRVAKLVGVSLDDVIGPKA